MRPTMPLGMLAAGLTAALVLAGWNGISAAPGLRAIPADLPGRAAPGSQPVDVELVLAVDISY